MLVPIVSGVLGANKRPGVSVSVSAIIISVSSFLVSVQVVTEVSGANQRPGVSVSVNVCGASAK